MSKAEKLDTKIFEYTPCFEVISWKYRYKHCKIYDKVFGIIYRYSQLEAGVCFASVKDTLAPSIGVTDKIFGKVLKELIQDGLIIQVKKEFGTTSGYVVSNEVMEKLKEEMDAWKSMPSGFLLENDTLGESPKGVRRIFVEGKENLPCTVGESTTNKKESLSFSFR